MSYHEVRSRLEVLGCAGTMIDGSLLDPDQVQAHETERKGPQNGRVAKTQPTTRRAKRPASQPPTTNCKG